MGMVADFEKELNHKAPQNFARWHRVDLHNHSPSSFDYRGNKQTALEGSAEQILKSGVSVVMFTDHEKLPDATFTTELARRTKKTILRGMELNVFVDAWGKPEGKVDKNLFFHLLIGLDPDGKQQPEYWATHIYKECGDTIRTCGNQQIRGISGSIDALCEVLREANAIVIPAHLHSTRDAFRSRSVDDIYADPQFLRHAKSHFDALEVTDTKTAEFFDGKHKETEYICRTCIRSSDAHEPDLLGTRVTFAQMEVPSFSELKAALRLPFRISLAPPEEPSAYIIGVQVKGQFYPDLWMSFSPHCNALIGVKGSGKTSLLEALRFALGAPVPASHQESVTGHLQTILGPNGTVRVLVKRDDGAKLIVERSLQSPEFKITFEDDRREVFARPDGLLFPTYILGWHEIEQAATDANIRQVYLDTIAGREQMRGIHEAADIAAKQIRQLHEVASTKYSTFRSLHEQVTRLDELRRGLQELTDGNLIAMRDQYETAIRHRDAVDQLHRAVESAYNDLDIRASSLVLTPERSTFEGTSPVSGCALDAYELVKGLDENIAQFKSSYKDELQRVQEGIGHLKARLDDSFDAFLKDYNSRLSGLPAEKRRLLESHQRVMEDTRALPGLKAQQDIQQREIEAVITELIGHCERVASELDRRTESRQRSVAELNQRLAEFGVQLAVEPLAIRARLESLTQRYAAGAKIYGELNTFAAGERRYHRRLARAYENLRADLVNGFKVFFDSAEFGFFVDYFEEDDLKIRFRAKKAGEEFSPIDQLSAGQRCTAVFPLLLKLQEGPLIVDQPEDNLDNRHIADVIAPALLVDKKTRQVAFTSHNANLVVLTDAEHIVAFEATGSEGRAEARGFLCASHSTITRHVVAILDGGERALELRYQKYGKLLPN